MMNRVFVKAFLPTLPPRFSTMIGELAWNPWQWGDVMPQRQSASNHRSRDDDNVVQDERTSPAAPQPSSNSPTWKFLRSSSPSNQMPKPNAKDSSDMSPNPTGIDVIEPVRGLVHFHQNTTRSEETLPESSAVNSVDTKQSAVSTEQDVATEKDECQNRIMPTPLVSGYDRSNRGKNDFGRMDEKASVELPTSRSLVLSPASAAQPNDAHLSTPLAAFGLSENNRATTSPSSEEFTQSRDAGGTVESQLYLQENTNQTWLPSMMDKKDYDFRDRRLNY
jgi:hypothetical protein